MAKPKNHLTWSNANTAVVLACIVDTLNEFDQSFKGRFLKKLAAVSGANAPAGYGLTSTQIRKSRRPD
jgi:hypothetical protein